MPDAKEYIDQYVTDRKKARNDEKRVIAQEREIAREQNAAELLRSVTASVELASQMLRYEEMMKRVESDNHTFPMRFVVPGFKNVSDYQKDDVDNYPDLDTLIRSVGFSDFADFLVEWQTNIGTVTITDDEFLFYIEQIDAV